MKPATISLSDRMKRYETVTQTELMRRTPVIIRLDGKNFSNYTRSLTKPFDKDLSDAMDYTLKILISEIQGASFGYTQSDEISLCLQDYENLNTDAWFGNNIQKIVSIAASLATSEFNLAADRTIKHQSRAIFDCRVFNLPKEEVVNYFIWRQQDCIRNSIQMTAQHFIGHKKIQGVKNSVLLEELKSSEYAVDWETMINPRFKYGFTILRDKSVLGTDFLYKERREEITNLVYLKEKKENE